MPILQVKVANKLAQGDIHATVGAHYDVLRSIISGDGSECMPSEQFYAELLNEEWGGN